MDTDFSKMIGRSRGDETEIRRSSRREEAHFETGELVRASLRRLLRHKIQAAPVEPAHRLVTPAAIRLDE